MTDRETLEAAKARFVLDTPNEKLVRDVIDIAERQTRKSALWEELADQRALEIAELSEQQDAKWEQAQAEADSASPYSYGVKPQFGDHKDKELATLQAEHDELRELLTPLKDAVLYARSQRKPIRIGQASDKAPASTTLRLGVQFGRERYADGFWIECDELGPQDKNNPNPATRIALELLRLAYAVADKART